MGYIGNKGLMKRYIFKTLFEKVMDVIKELDFLTWNGIVPKCGL